MNGFWNLDDIDKKIEHAPSTILSDQVEAFDEYTDGVLYAKLSESQNHQELISGYELMTELVIIAPKLDGYQYKLLTVFSNLDPLYPVGLVANYNDDLPSILKTDHICKDYNEFITKLREIIGSQRTSDIVRVLYSKSKGY